MDIPTGPGKYPEASKVPLPAIPGTGAAIRHRLKAPVIREAAQDMPIRPHRGSRFGAIALPPYNETALYVQPGPQIRQMYNSGAPMPAASGTPIRPATASRVPAPLQVTTAPQRSVTPTSVRQRCHPGAAMPLSVQVLPAEARPATAGPAVPPGAVLPIAGPAAAQAGAAHHTAAPVQEAVLRAP